MKLYRKFGALSKADPACIWSSDVTATQAAEGLVKAGQANYNALTTTSMSQAEEAATPPILRDPVINPENGRDALDWYYGEDAGGFVLNFGKYAGKSLNQAPIQYLQWCRNTFTRDHSHPTFMAVLQKFQDGLDQHAETNFGDFVIPLRKHLGETIRECALSSDRQYLEWLCKKDQQHLRVKYGNVFFKAAENWLRNNPRQRINSPRENWLRNNRRANLRRISKLCLFCESCDDGYFPLHDDYGMGYGEDYDEGFGTASTDTWLDDGHEQPDMRGMVPDEEEDEAGEEGLSVTSDDEDDGNQPYEHVVQDSGDEGVEQTQGVLVKIEDSVNREGSSQAHTQYGPSVKKESASPAPERYQVRGQVRSRSTSEKADGNEIPRKRSRRSNSPSSSVKQEARSPSYPSTSRHPAPLTPGRRSERQRAMKATPGKQEQ